MMANYGGNQNGQIQPGPSTTRTQPIIQPMQTQSNPQPPQNYVNWFGNPQIQQPTQMATEQRGITVCYMVNSRQEYGYYTPMAGQTIAIFNFPEHELCLKARDMYGVDLTQRTWDLNETTQSPITQIPQPTNSPIQDPEPMVSKSEFDEMKAKFEALYKELKG